LECRELEGRRYRAADQGPIAERARRLPGTRRNDALRALAGGKIVAEHKALAWSGRRYDFELKRRTGMPVPDFDRVDPVPVRALAARQEKIDCGRDGTGAVHRFAIPKSLPVVPAFRMRLEIQKPDDLGGGEHLRARWPQVESSSPSRPTSFMHDLFGKSVPTFPDHALESVFALADFRKHLPGRAAGETDVPRDLRQV